MSGQDPNAQGAILALLIDADNASPKHVGILLTEATKHGTLCVRRAYGDWTKPHLSQWKECLLEHSIQPVQQFAYTTGKNSTDGAMIIDAMDLLHTGRFDGFCLVSSDSDFTRLAVRIREQGLRVYGFGRSQTALPFTKACDHFFFVNEPEVPEEVAPAAPLPKPKIVPPPQPKVVPEAKLKPKATPAKPKPTPTKSAPVAKKPGDKKLHALLKAAIETAADERGWADLTTLGNHLRKQTPSFTSKSYGFSRLSSLVEATGLFEVDNSAKAFSSIRIRPKAAP